VSRRKRIWWLPIVSFLVHVLCGAVFFFVLCTTSIGLSLIVQSVEANFRIPALTLLVVTGLEQTIVIVDAVLFVAYLAVTAARTLKEILR
jgi:hypothetical protein